jgi:ABC-type branched-subunit amino acid transport system substrate-binding protein
MTDRRPLWLLALAAALLGCGGQAAAEAVPIGLLLSYSGALAANSINSERGLLMAIEAANRAGGIGGRPVSVIARDSRSDPSRVTPAANELIAAGTALFIGPDTPDLAVELKGVLAERTVIMPSFTTSSNFAKPRSWFVMGVPAVRVACELFKQLPTSARKKALVVADPNGYNSLLAFQLTTAYGIPWVFLPADVPSNETTVQPIVSVQAEAYLLAALPPSASSLLYTMAAIGALKSPDRWYLSPTLHTPALLETIPKGMLSGAHGVATGPLGEVATEFRQSFQSRWGDTPLDDAYSFYDAGAVAVLALERAAVQEGAIPPGTGLAAHIVAVTARSANVVGWNEIDRGLELLRQGQEVDYVGLSGSLAFDLSGQTAPPQPPTVWWTIEGEDFRDAASVAECP